MRKHYFFLFVLLFFALADSIQAQNIKGVVLDYDTKEVVPFANIYFSATMHGTTSDHDGLFKLKTDGYFGQDIVVSCVGDDSWIIKDFQSDRFYKIYLKPSSKLLRELLVVHKDLPRKKKEKMFLYEFLGTSLNASSCEIQNLEDVILTYFKSTQTLEAYCFEPILIHNERLGYKIKYFLDSFKLDNKNMFYQGNFLFEEMETTDPKQKEKIDKRRRNAYYGSRMHFFRVLWNGDEGNIDFYLENFNSEKLYINSLVSEEINNLKCFLPQGSINIYYGGAVSAADFKGKNCIPFSKSGFFDSKDIFWRGKMSKQRIGDLLPFEYWPYM